MSEIADRVKEVRQGYQRALETLRADRDLTPEARAKRIALAWQATSNEMARLRKQHGEAKVQRRRELEMSLFGPRYSHGATETDKVHLRADYRAALDRAEQAKAPEEALDLLNRAELTADTTLARAVAAVAASRGYARVLDRYAASRSDVAEALDELTGLADKRQAIAESFAFSAPPKPSEVTFDIERVRDVA